MLTVLIAGPVRGGPSTGADHMVATTLELGKPVWHDLDQSPTASD